jgi:hypothetical protein
LTEKISPIIYIWYEVDGSSPPVVTANGSSEAESQQLKAMAKKAAQSGKKRPRRSGDLPF